MNFIREERWDPSDESAPPTPNDLLALTSRFGWCSVYRVQEKKKERLKNNIEYIKNCLNNSAISNHSHDRLKNRKVA